MSNLFSFIVSHLINERVVPVEYLIKWVKSVIKYRKEQELTINLTQEIYFLQVKVTFLKVFFK